MLLVRIEKVQLNQDLIFGKLQLVEFIAKVTIFETPYMADYWEMLVDQSLNKFEARET